MGSFTPTYPPGLPIAGSWITDDLDTAEIRFPYDGSLVAESPVGHVRHAQLALDAGVAAVPAAATLSSSTRRAILLRVQEEIAKRRGDFEQVLVAETGKPLVDCRTEVERVLFTWTAAAEEVARLHGETVPLDLQPSGSGMIGFWARKPIGLVIGICGFNYPLLLATHKIAPSIAAACPVICKPAPDTPLSTLWLVHVIHEVLAESEVTTDMVQLVTGGAQVGRTLTTEPRIGAVSFTGSAEIGHQIARDCASRKVLLELGSNAALIVAADADLDKAADAVVRGGSYGNGQACISVQRVVVVDSVADDFTERVQAKLEALVLGDPRSAETRVSALINTAATRRVQDWIHEAVAAGAQIVSGGELTGTVLEPTVLVHVPDGVRAWEEEIFGPVVCLRSVPDVDTAIEVVNRSRYGLHASVYTTSLATAFRAVERLEVGGVVVNEAPGFRSDIMPYGGVKDSGIGREGPRFAVEELTVTRMAVIRPE